jgi:hypothetical protein
MELLYLLLRFCEMHSRVLILACKNSAIFPRGFMELWIPLRARARARAREREREREREERGRIDSANSAMSPHISRIGKSAKHITHVACSVRALNVFQCFFFISSMSSSVSSGGLQMFTGTFNIVYFTMFIRVSTLHVKYFRYSSLNLKIFFFWPLSLSLCRY